MENKTIIKIALVPIWLLLMMFLIQYTFGLISEPNTLHVIIGFVLLSILIFLNLILINKLYFKK